MTAVEIPAAENPYAASAPNEWERREIERLQQMDAFVSPATQQSLGPVLAEVAATVTSAKPELLDVGGGVGVSTEEMCDTAGVGYTIADLNQRFLGFRDTPEGRKFAANAEQLPFTDDAFDVTHSRATVAWTDTPENAISELFRVTKKDGGTVVITDFDWGAARADFDSGAMEQIMEVRAMFMGALVAQGFRPEYGRVSGDAVDAVASTEGVKIDRQEHRFEFPGGDHSAFLLEMVQPLHTFLKEKNPPAAAVLESNMKAIREASEAGTVSMKLPALVTQVVRLAGVQQPAENTPAQPAE